MKKHSDDTKISRRKILKGITFLGAIACLPKILHSMPNEKMTTHFIGLGGAGSNAIEFFHSKGVKGKFTCISNPERSSLPGDIKFIYFNPTVDNTNSKNSLEISEGEENFEIPNKLLNIINNNEKIVLLSGLGGYTGTVLTKKLSLLLHKENISFQTFTSFPFFFEGTKRRIRAQNVIDNLSHLPGFNYFKMADLKTKYSNLKVRSAFDKGNKCIYDLYVNKTFI